MGYKTMTSIFSSHNPTKEEKEKINSFFFVRWLSNHPNAIFIGNVFNRFHKEIPIFVQYDIAKLLLNKKIKFISFPKKIVNDETQKIIENISRFYNINLSKAQEYYDIMSEQKRQYFMKLYDTNI